MAGTTSCSACDEEHDGGCGCGDVVVLELTPFTGVQLFVERMTALTDC